MHTILMVEDDENLRNTVSSALRKHQFKVLEAGTSLEGVAMAQNDPPDLILCDLNLGQADRSGPLLRDIAVGAGIPFVLMTGEPQESSDGVELLPKPFTLRALLSTIRKQLRQQPEGARPPSPEEALESPKTSNPQPAHSHSGSPGPGLPKPRLVKASSEELEEVLARVQSLREAERTRVARAIHDELTQKMTVLAIDLSLLESDLSSNGGVASAETLETVGKLGKLVNELIASAQEITSQLRPKILEEFGFLAGLEWLVQQFEKRSGATCRIFVSDPEPVLEAGRATELYRLAQEILVQLAEHSQATAVRVTVQQTGGYLLMEFQDDGEGTARQPGDPASLEFLAMRQRAGRLGGILKVHREPGKGTATIVRVPLEGIS